ncbi:GDF3 factor, partial [Dicaeum eximium]|nr:GDF3 factor [Dicaeum eximium]
WASGAAMWLLLILLSPVLAAGPGWHESSLLKSLGLSARPSPKSPGPVPPVLWRIFHTRKALPRPDTERDPCRVEELNVPGDIVRVFADQGTATFGAPLGPSSFPAAFQEKSLPCELPLGAGGDDFWVWSPRRG